MARIKRNISDEYNTPLASRLRFLLEESGITQNQLAKKIGKTRQAVNSYTLGTTVPDSDTIVKLSQFFGVSSDYLLGLSDVKTQNRDLQFVCDYTKLSEEAVRKLASCDKEHSDSSSFRAILNSFISSKAFSDIVREIGQYIAQKEKLEELQKCSEFSDEIRTLEKEVDFSLFCIQERISDFAKNIKIH